MSCYICGKEKESVEHAPPKSFFPKGKRNSLITVNSCKVHNQDTSLDDEYVRNIITMMIQGSSIAYDHFLTKSIKSFSRSPALLKSTTEKWHPVNYNGVDTKAIEIDRDRVDVVMRKIAYAVFYHKYSQRWLRKLITATTYLKIPNLENDDLGDMIEELQNKHTPAYEGNNPEAFQYAFMETDGNINNQILRMRFYEGFEIWMIPDGDEANEPELNTLY